MLIKSEFDVGESPDKVWEFFNNIPLVANCLPGADLSEQVSEDEYAGSRENRRAATRSTAGGPARRPGSSRR